MSNARKVKQDEHWRRRCTERVNMVLEPDLLLALRRRAIQDHCSASAIIRALLRRELRKELLALDEHTPKQ